MTTVVEFPDRHAIAEEAAAWLVRLDADAPPAPEDLQALGEWLHRSPAHRDQLENLATLWGRLNILTELAVPLAHPGRAETASGLAGGTAYPGGLRRGAWLLAASFAVALTAGWLLLAHHGSEAFLATNGLYATGVGQQERVALEDGSQVTLNTGTQIRVDYGGGYRRVHLLQGEALFTVARNAGRPFRVYAGTGRIEALGTAFSVYLNGSQVSVAVTEGRVSLAATPPAAGNSRPPLQAPGRHAGGEATPERDDARMDSLGILAAGHIATIQGTAANAAGAAATLQAVRSLAPQELQQRLAWRDGVLVFSGETLQEVIEEFGRYTTASIEIPDPAVRQVRIGGRFAVGETEAMLSALEANFNLRVTRLGHNRVVISAADK